MESSEIEREQEMTYVCLLVDEHEPRRRTIGVYRDVEFAETILISPVLIPAIVGI